MTQKITPDEYINMQNLVKQAKFEDAEKILEKWLENEPENVMFLLDMAFVKANISKINEAEKLYEKVIEIVPENPSGWAGMGFLHRENGNSQKALEFFSKSLEKDPTNTMVHFEMGEIYFEADNYVEAKNKYLKAIQFGDEDSEPETLHRIVQCELGKNDLDETIRKGINLLERFPDMISGYKILGTAYLLRKNYKQSIEAFEKYLKSIPNDESVKNLLEKAKSKFR